MTRHNHNILFHLLHMGKIYQIAVVAPAEWSVFQFLFNALQGIIDMEGAFCIIQSDGMSFRFNIINL
mgnify:FL=1